MIRAGVLPHDCAIPCTQLLTLDKQDLLRHRGDLGEDQLEEVNVALVKLSHYGVPDRPRPAGRVGVVDADVGRVPRAQDPAANVHNFYG